jgi:hypothetical protein
LDDGGEEGYVDGAMDEVLLGLGFSVVLADGLVLVYWVGYVLVKTLGVSDGIIDGEVVGRTVAIAVGSCISGPGDELLEEGKRSAGRVDSGCVLGMRLRASDATNDGEVVFPSVGAATG